jgi:hypothetical protein
MQDASLHPTGASAACCAGLHVCSAPCVAHAFPEVSPQTSVTQAQCLLDNLCHSVIIY